MKIISFNSYKGGACRTTTCYNALPYIAELLGATSARPILVFDVDLDSMGLTNLFTWGNRFVSEVGYSSEYLFVNREVPAGKADINNRIRFAGFQGAVADNDWFFEKAFMKVGNALGLKDDGSVLFCGADCEADSLTDSEFNKYNDMPPVQIMLDALEEMDEPPCAVIFDCASGVQLSTRAILRTARKVVMCMRPTFQFRVGTRDYLLEKIRNEIRINLNNTKKEIILLPTSVASTDVPENDPNRESAMETLIDLRHEVLEDIERFIVNRVKSRESVLGYTLNDVMLRDEENFGIPEVERFKWKESLLYTEEPITQKERELKERYKKLAEVIIKD